MQSFDSNMKSVERSPTHSMVLRSTCRWCCASESTYDLAGIGRSSRHRNLHEKYLNSNVKHQHHKDHHLHHQQDVVEKYVVQDVIPVYIDHTVQSSTKHQANSKTLSEEQQVATSFLDNITEKICSSLNTSSVEKETATSLSIAKIRKKLFSNSSSDFSSTKIVGDICSYRCVDESLKFGSSGDVNNSCHKEDMSRTRIKTGRPLHTSHSAYHEEFDKESNIDVTSTFEGGHNGSLRIPSGTVMNSSSDVFLERSNNSTDRTKLIQKTFSSRMNNFNSLEGSSDEELSPNNVVQEEINSFTNVSLNNQDVKTTYLDFIINMFRWLFYKWVYLMACKVLLADAWILSRCSKFGKKKLLGLLLSLLLALWFFGFFPLRNATVDDSHQIFKFSDDFGSLLYYGLGMFINNYNKTGAFPATCDKTKTECGQNGPSYSGRISAETQGNAAILDVKTTSIPSSSGFEISDEKIKLLALEVFERESIQLVKQLSLRNKEDQAKLMKDIQKVQSDIDPVTSQYQSLLASLQTLRIEIAEQQRTNTDDADRHLQNQEHLSTMDAKLHDLQEKLQSFETMLAGANKCCGDQSVYLSAESQLNSLLQKVMDGSEDENFPMLYAFQNWLKWNFISRQNLSSEISAAIETMYGKSFKMSEKHYEDIAKRVAESVFSKSMASFEESMSSHTSISTSHTQSVLGAFGLEDVQKIIKEAILLYDADKTARVDYALESGGGSVVSIRCSETYSAGAARLSIFGLPLWYIPKSPRTAIQPEIQPGECWAFHGSQGFLVIELSATIIPTGFTLEHIPKSLTPTGTIDSAPKNFSVWGLSSDKNDEGVLMGEFMYDSEGEPLQYFPVTSEIESYFSVIELKIHSNWGNQKFTCLYRFRVHGMPL